MKTYGIDYLSIDNYLFDVRLALQKKHCIDEAIALVDPLQWYITTGRASVLFLHRLVAVRPFMVARRLEASGSVDEVMDRIRKLIGME